MSLVSTVAPFHTLTAKVAAMTDAERSARVDEIAHGGPANDETRIELARLWGGPNVTGSDCDKNPTG